MKLINKVKLVATIIMLSIFYSVSSVQDVFIIEGKCYKVIKLLKEEYKNDSIAIEYFQKHYVIDDECSIRNAVKRNDYKYVIHYYNQKSKQDCHCILKSHYYNKTLIDNTNN